VVFFVSTKIIALHNEAIDMSLRINEIAPDFSAETTQGPIHFHEWIGDNWAVLFSHPKDFTPVCTTELGAVAALEDQFAARGAKVIGLSVDPVSSHSKWADDIKEVTGYGVNYPLIGDPELKVAKLYDMLPADAGDSCEGRTPANNATARSVFVIGPDKRIKLTLTYPMTTGRNFDEILRVLDSIQLTAKHRVATPANWKQGEEVIITGAVSNEEADKIFPGYKTVKPYLRTVAQPQ
jgi:thioredoxin-dependent peroxiredoxin